MPKLNIIKNRKAGYLTNVPVKVITYLRNTGKFDNNNRVEYDEAMDAINRNLSGSLPKTKRSPLIVELYQTDRDKFKTIQLPKDKQLIFFQSGAKQRDLFFDDLLSYVSYVGDNQSLLRKGIVAKDILKEHWGMTDKQIRDMANAQSLKRDVKNSVSNQQYEDNKRKRELLNPTLPWITVKHKGFSVSITPSSDLMNYLVRTRAIDPADPLRNVSLSDYEQAKKFELEGKLSNESVIVLNKSTKKKSTTNIPEMPKANNQKAPIEKSLGFHPILSQDSVISLKLSPSQVKKVKYGDRISIRPDQINHPQSNYKFPNMGKHNRDALHDALTTGKRRPIRLFVDEIEGSGIKDFFRGVGKFFKDNWKTIKPVVSTVLDLGAPALAKSFPEFAPAIIGTRQLIKSTTGTGACKGGSFKAAGVGGKLVKGSQAAKDHMAKLRAMRVSKAKSEKVSSRLTATQRDKNRVSIMDGF